jgi:hypothetical protein
VTVPPTGRQTFERVERALRAEVNERLGVRTRSTYHWNRGLEVPTEYAARPVLFPLGLRGALKGSAELGRALVYDDELIKASMVREPGGS